MATFNWQKWVGRSFDNRRVRAPRSRRPALEVLEERSLLSFTSASGINISATEGTAFAGPVASFASPDIGPFAATIAWGDGATSAGTIARSLAPLSLTGFNQDVVFEAGANPKVSHDFDNSGFAWFQAGATDTSNVTHDDGLLTSFTSKFGTPFQFQGFTGNNVLLLGLRLPDSGTLALTTPASYGTLAILASSSVGSRGW